MRFVSRKACLCVTEIIIFIVFMSRQKWLALLLVAIGTTAGAQDVVQQLQLREPIKFRTPVMNDSINIKGEKYSAKELLKTPLMLRFPEEQTSVASLDSGLLVLQKADSCNLIYLAGWQMRAENFMKSKLKIISPVRWELFINGESKKVKDTAEDNLQSAKEETVDLRLEPEADCELAIKVLSVPEDKAAPEVKIEIVRDESFGDVKCRIEPRMKRRFSLDNTVYGHRVIGVSISPDGRDLLTRFYNNMKGNRSVIHNELRDLKENKVILSNVRDGMRWMPRSNKLYYTVQAAQGYDVITFDPASLQEEVILKGVPEGGFTWSPTEDYLIYYPSESGDYEQGPLKRVVSPADRIPYTRGRSFLARYDVNTGLSERLTFGNHSTYLNDISPDGRYLLYSTSRENVTKRPFSIGSLFRMDLQTMKVDTLMWEESFMANGNFSPDGRQILLTGCAEAFNGVGKNCGEHPVSNDYDTQAFIMSLDGKDGNGKYPVKPITKNFNPSVDFLQWNSDDGCIYFNTADKDCRHIYRYNPEKDEFDLLPLETDVVQGFAMGDKNASVAAYFGQDNHNSGVEYLYRVKKRSSVLLADPMHETLGNIALGETEEWNFIASDGTEINGMVCLPPEFDASRKYPLIVYYYGGTTPTERGISNPYCSQLFASRGYVVYVIQPSGTIGYGQEFSARHVNAWGKRTADDIIEGVKQFCKEHPFVDAAKIGCLGASYGGFMTMYLQTRTDIFAAAVSHAGISNVTSYWGEGYWGYGYNAVAAADSYPWNNPDLFVKQGALFNADKINTPLLLLHGTVDTNVPIGESIQLFNALKILGKEVEFVQVEGENHFVSDYNKRILWHASIMAWFERWLKDKPAWWNELYPERRL